MEQETFLKRYGIPLTLGLLTAAALGTGCVGGGTEGDTIETPIPDDDPLDPTATVTLEPIELPEPEIGVANQDGLQNWATVPFMENDEPLLTWLQEEDEEMNRFPDFQVSLFREEVDPSGQRLAITLCEEYEKFRDDLVPSKYKSTVEHWQDFKPELETVVPVLLFNRGLSDLTSYLAFIKEGYHVEQHKLASEYWHNIYGSSEDPEISLTEYVCPERTLEQEIRHEALGYLRFAEVARKNENTIRETIDNPETDQREDSLLEATLSLANYLDTQENNGISPQEIADNEEYFDNWIQKLLETGFLPQKFD